MTSTYTVQRQRQRTDRRDAGPVTHVSRGIKGEIQSSICDLDEVILDALASREPSRVHEVRRPELPRPTFLLWIRINSDDARGFHESGSVDDAEANATTTEDSNGGTLYPLLFDDGTPGGGYTASEETNLLQGSGGVDGDDRDIGNDCVLRERRGSHLRVGLSTTPKGRACGTGAVRNGRWVGP